MKSFFPSLLTVARFVAVYYNIISAAGERTRAKIILRYSNRIDGNRLNAILVRCFGEGDFPSARETNRRDSRDREKCAVLR